VRSEDKLQELSVHSYGVIFEDWLLRRTILLTFLSFGTGISTQSIHHYSFLGWIMSGLAIFSTNLLEEVRCHIKRIFSKICQLFRMTVTSVPSPSTPSPSLLSWS